MTSPSITLITPYSPPPNSVVVSSVYQMYALSYAPSLDMTYFVGISPTENPGLTPNVAFTFQNLTLNCDLQVTMKLPNYLQTTQQASFTAPQYSTTQFTFTFNEDGAKYLSTLKHGIISQSLLFEVTPLNVTGPIYIGTVPPPSPVTPSDPNPPTTTTGTTPPTTTGGGGTTNTGGGGTTTTGGGGGVLGQ